MVSRFEADLASSVLSIFFVLAWLGIPFFTWQLGGIWFQILAVPVFIVTWGLVAFLFVGSSAKTINRRRARKDR